MQINRVQDDENSDSDWGPVTSEDDISHAYSTASELFDLISKNRLLDGNEDESLTTRDLVLLYKNIDLGTKLMSNANEFKRKTPNQYVESVVYQDDSDTDISENYSNEDLQHVVMVNKERIDLLNNLSSLENTLCQKYGNGNIQTSSIAMEKDLLFKHVNIREQIKNFGALTKFNDANEYNEPASLLDYICCKRLEDNYNFYMDNIIRYVTNTINQLKRISNGDYLTDKAKAKWKEVVNEENKNQTQETKILANSTSIPLPVEDKLNRDISTWDDIVHSEVDVRSLSKILEKKIILEIPQLLCGSYRLFSQCNDKNLVLTCKRETQLSNALNDEGSRLDVVLKLSRSESGHVTSDINSIIILKHKVEVTGTLKALTNNSGSDSEGDGKNDPKIVELGNDDSVGGKNIEQIERNDYVESLGSKSESIKSEDENTRDTGGFSFDLNNSSSISKSATSLKESNISSNTDDNNMANIMRQSEQCDMNMHGELCVTMQRLNQQICLPEESQEDLSLHSLNKNKSLTKVRVKSPYENKSFVMEEKKRKRLLEIRQRREKKKIAMTENCKISKHKFGKAAIMPQPSNSVTKLSITNKSFYNSIYGPSININLDKHFKLKSRKNKCVLSPSDYSSYETNKSSGSNNQKYIDRSFYLDDAVTEMMFMDNTQSNGTLSNEFNADITALSQLLTPSFHETSIPNATQSEISQGVDNISQLRNLVDEGDTQTKQIIAFQNVAPTNSPIKDGFNRCRFGGDETKKMSASKVFRKSIDKIYDLIKTMDKNNDAKLQVAESQDNGTIADQGSFINESSDSGTSTKHQLLSSNPSSGSFSKSNNLSVSKTKNNVIKKSEVPAVVSKVIINSKPVSPKIETPKLKSERKKETFPVNIEKTTPYNPLTTISQLLNRIENNQTPKQKFEKRNIRKPSVTEEKNSPRHDTRRYLRTQSRDTDLQPERYAKFQKDRKHRDNLDNPIKFPPHLRPADDKRANKIIIPKHVTDIVDELKEAKGEAVRGPSKFSSRLNTLAQPRRPYVPTQENLPKYSKFRDFATPDSRDRRKWSTTQERNTPSANVKQKTRRGTGEVLSTFQKPPAPPAALDNGTRPKSSNTNPEGTLKTFPKDPPIKSNHNPEKASRPKSSSDYLEGIKSKTPYYKRNYIPEPPDRLEKKLMMVVQPNLKTVHNNITLANLITPELSNTKEMDQLFPKVPSLGVHHCNRDEQKSNTNVLRHDINLMFHPVASLTPLTEIKESSSINFKTNDSNEVSPLEIGFDIGDKVEPLEESSSKILKDSTTDKDDTASENISKNSNQDDVVSLEKKCIDSMSEYEMLENALCNRLGHFQKRLRIRNFTLTPKQSKQQVILLHSGDTNSIIESTVSHKSKINNCKSETMTDMLSKCHHTSSYFANFPSRVTAVGYNFPEYNFLRAQSKSTHKCINTTYNTTKTSLVDTDFKEIITVSSAVHIKSNEIDKIYSRDVIEKRDIVNKDVVHMTDNKVRSIAQNVAEQINTVKGKIEPHSMYENKRSVTNGNETTEKANLTSTTSLDLLVGLLNEIQTITTCQTQITNHISEIDENNESVPAMEYILKEAITLDKKSNAQKKISMTTIDNFRQIESISSIFSFYLSQVKNNNDNKLTPRYVNKEVSVDFPVKEFCSKFTDVPSKLFSLTHNNGTIVTNSLLGILSEPSSQSTISFTSCLQLKSALNSYKIVEIPQHVEAKNDELIKSDCLECFQQKLNRLSETAKNKTVDEKLTVNEEQKKRIGNSHDLNETAKVEFVMKMKRDILLTIYSVLMFTVFAALSFPEIYGV